MLSLTAMAQIPEKKVLTIKENSLRALQETGVFDLFQVSSKNHTPITESNLSTGISINFPPEFFSEHEGRPYAIGYLLNNTSQAVLLPMIDATVDNVKQYFFIDNRWVLGKQMGISTCGNSYYKSKIDAKHKMRFEMSLDLMAYGELKVPYKIGILIDGVELFSNSIDVYLHPNQLETLLSPK